MHTKWSVSGNELSPVEVDSLHELIGKGVYRINFNPIDGFSLTRLEDRFVFNHKIYGLESTFINHVHKTFLHTNGNLGVMLNGTKGGGKSLTCKVLANKFDLPILLVEQNFGIGLVKFLSRIQQDILVFVDEYEKVYSNGNSDDEGDEGEKDSSLLTLMDGVLKTEHRRVFLLTTNKLSVNANLLQRPGRIRYLKEFGNLPRITIEEIVDDMLVHPHLRDVTVKFIAQLELITIDIVTALVTEVNIHECDLETLVGFLNVVKNPVKYDLIQIHKTGKVKESALRYASDLDDELSSYEVGDYIGNNRTNFGTVIEILPENTYVIKLDYGHGLKVKEKEGDLITMRIEPIQSFHSSFAGMNAF